MKLKIACLAVLLILSIAILTNVSEHNKIATNISRSARVKYDFNIKFPQDSPSSVNIYTLNNKELNIVDARIYGGLFGYKTECVENESAFFFEDPYSTLTLNKNNGLISYQNKQQGIFDTKITEEEAKDISERFIKEKFKTLYYAQAEVAFDNNEFIIKFINTLENKKNYSYPITAYLDQYGNIKQVDYYKNSYIKKASAHIISMQKASEQLTTEAGNLSGASLIDIKNADLVYIKKDGLIIPAYLFIGELAGGIAFEQIIPAMK